MFTQPLDILLLFLISTPTVGWLLRKKDHGEFLGIYILSGLLVVAYSLYGLYKEVVKNGIILIANQPPFNPKNALCLVILPSYVFCPLVPRAAV